MFSAIVISLSGGKCPFAQLPLLEVEGVTLSQSMTILRFVAKRHGMQHYNNITAPFNNMRNLKFKSLPTVAFSRPSIII